MRKKDLLYKLCTICFSLHIIFVLPSSMFFFGEAECPTEEQE